MRPTGVRWCHVMVSVCLPQAVVPESRTRNASRDLETLSGNLQFSSKGYHPSRSCVGGSRHLVLLELFRVVPIWHWMRARPVVLVLMQTVRTSPVKLMS